MIAADTAIRYRSQKPNRSMEVICVEQDHENFQRLIGNMQRYQSVSVLLQGDFVSHLDIILEKLQDWPALVLLDPFGIKAIREEPT